MRPLDALEALARLAVVTDAPDRIGALTEATRIVGAVIGAHDVRIFVGDGINYDAYPQREAEDFFGLSPAGVLSVGQALRSLRGPAVHTVGEDGLPHDVAPADGARGGALIALSLWRGGAYGGALVALGPWTPQAARRAGRILGAAAPALGAVLELVVDAERAELVQRQMNALGDVARVLNRGSTVREVLSDIVGAIHGATGFVSSVDVLDARGRIAIRSTASGRYQGTPLYQAWLDMTKAPDRVRKMILKDHQPVLLPDLQNDPRLSAEAQEFYRRASLVSGATFPLLLQDEVVGLLRVGSLSLTSFPPPIVDLLKNLAIQAAVVVRGAQSWDQLQRARRQTERYAAKLHTRNQELLKEIAERERADNRVKYLAFHDALTGLPNRRLFEEHLATSLAQRRRDERPLGVMFLDLDNFKAINDIMGHTEGDRALKEVAERLTSTLREGDTVARLGGDEFTVLLPALSDAENLLETAERILERLRRPWKCGGHEFHTTASIGMAMHPQDGEDPETLLRHADIALYRAKAQGRDQFVLFTPEMNALVRKRVTQRRPRPPKAA